jgi:hypothetical protein
VPASSTAKGEMMKVKVWARRVWTLELSLVSAADPSFLYYPDRCRLAFTSYPLSCDFPGEGGKGRLAQNVLLIEVPDLVDRSSSRVV